MKVIEAVHGGYVARRRVRVLAERIAPLLPRESRILDVGSGDGAIASLIALRRPDVDISGVDVLVRPQTVIPTEQFDGIHLPYEDASFDGVILVDVLHHADDPLRLLEESTRVATQSVLVKDVVARNRVDRAILAFMDRVGNERFGVALPYNFWSPSEWRDGLNAAGLRVSRLDRSLGLYPPPASWVFERSMQFIGMFERQS
jgi:SAM-dependent methyltransferase